ncbi:MAG: TetR/AcrR family transcriptional regulator [Syntrophaceae bacterium]|nr:TetR/AcrR family transcriptional regulator [Syntrophaceae bacterium]
MAKNLDKEKILDVVRTMSVKYGFDKLTLADIVRPLGVKKTALYHYFPGGKWEMIEAMLHSEEEKIMRKMEEAVAGESDPRQKLRAMVLSVLEHTRGLREMLDVPREMAEQLGVIYGNLELSFNRNMIDMLVAILEEGKLLKIFMDIDTSQLAMSIHFIMHRIHPPLAYEESWPVLKERVDGFLNLLFYGIVRPECRPVPEQA